MRYHTQHGIRMNKALDSTASTENVPPSRVVRLRKISRHLHTLLSRSSKSVPLITAFNHHDSPLKHKNGLNRYMEGGTGQPNPRAWHFDQSDGIVPRCAFQL